MKLKILDEAEQELREAAHWYEQRLAGLGHALLEQAIDGFEQILNHPRRFPRYPTPRNREIRRLLMDRFPYAIVYELIDDRPIILAIAHGARRPGYWRKRRPT